MFELPILTESELYEEEIFDLSSPVAPPRKLYVETYGCQMNVNDSEIVKGVMNNSGYAITDKPDDADVILLNTCAVRDNAEKKIHERLDHLKK